MKDSIFATLDKLGWSELTISHDRNKNHFTFSTKDKLVKSNFILDVLNEKSCGSYLQKILELISAGRHEKVEFLRNRKLYTSFLICIHSTTLGQPAGGIRRHDPEEDEMEVIHDTLNLSRAMSFKDAAAGLPNGGSKLGVISKMPKKNTPIAYYKFLAECIDRSKTFTGPDMGFTLEDANKMRKFTSNIVGGTAKTGSFGSTGITAAWGVMLAMKEAARFKFGDSTLFGRKIAVQGLGQLGGSLAKFLIEEKAKLIVTDVSEKAVEDFLRYAKSKNGTDVKAVPPAAIYGVSCDVLSPCARGGVITSKNIPKLRCKVLLGGANNPLDAISQEGEVKLVRQLAKRGILFVPDWIVNAGGVIHGQEEHIYGKNFSYERVREKTRIACQDGAHDVLELARSQRLTPLEAAYKKYEKVIYR